MWLAAAARPRAWGCGEMGRWRPRASHFLVPQLPPVAFGSAGFPTRRSSPPINTRSVLTRGGRRFLVLPFGPAGEQHACGRQETGMWFRMGRRISQSDCTQRITKENPSVPRPCSATPGRIRRTLRSFSSPSACRRSDRRSPKTPERWPKALAAPRAQANLAWRRLVLTVCDGLRLQRTTGLNEKVWRGDPDPPSWPLLTPTARRELRQRFQRPRGLFARVRSRAGRHRRPGVLPIADLGRRELVPRVDVRRRWKW